MREQPALRPPVAVSSVPRSRPTAVNSALPPSRWRYADPLAMVRHLWAHRDLTRQLSAREVTGRYKGSYLGLAWSFVTPLLMLVIYTFVFGIVFRSTWGDVTSDGVAGRIEFALTLFCGLIVFGVLSETMTRATSVIVRNPNYVKRVVFPLEILPVSMVVSAIVHAAIGLVVLLAGVVGVLHRVSPTLWLFPVSVLPLVLIALGLAWFLASLGVFIRDSEQGVSIVTTVLFFGSSVLYDTARVPERFRWVVEMNPVSVVVESARRTLLWGREPDWASWCWVALLSVVVMQAGYLWFMASKRWFADVI